MIWATPADIRAYLDDPEGDEAVLQREIDAAVRTLGPKTLRLPLVDDTDRVLDAEQRGHVVAAVGELIRARRARAAKQAATGGLLDIVEQGGSIASATLKVDGGARAGGSGVRDPYANDRVLPSAVLDAMLAAGLVGGSVPTW